MRESFIRYINTGEGTSVSGGATADPPVLLPRRLGPAQLRLPLPLRRRLARRRRRPGRARRRQRRDQLRRRGPLPLRAHEIDLTTAEPGDRAGRRRARGRSSPIAEDGGAPERQVLVNLDLSRAGGDPRRRQLVHLRTGARGDPGRHRETRSSPASTPRGPSSDASPSPSRLAADRASGSPPRSGRPWRPAARPGRLAQVTVVSPGGAQQTLSLDALAGSEDVSDRPYAVRSGAGESTQTVTGFSLAALLDAAGADPYSLLLPRSAAAGRRRRPAQPPPGARPGAFAEGRRSSTRPRPAPASCGPSGGAGDAQRRGLLRGAAGADHRPPQGRLDAGAGGGVARQDAARRAGRASSATSNAPAPARSSPTPGTSTTATRRAAPKPRHSFAKPGSYDVVVGVTSARRRNGRLGGGHRPGRRPDRGA